MEPETTPDAPAVDPAVPSAEVKGDTEPLSVSQTLDKLRAGGFDEVLKPEGGSDAAYAPEGVPADDDGVPGGDVSGDASGDARDAGEGDTDEHDAVADAATGEAGDTDADGSEGDADAPGDGADTEGLVVDIPGRREGETVQVEVSDPEMAERLRQLANNGMRRQEYNTQMENVRTNQAEIKQFKDRLATDPSGLILESATPQTREQIVRDILLSDPELLTRTLEKFNDIELDPNARAAATAEMERDAAVRARQVDKMAAETREYLDSANEIIGAVEALIPEDTPDEVVTAFLEDAYPFLEFKAQTEGPRVVNAQNIKNLLETRLRLHGIKPGTVSDTSDGSGNGADQPALPTVALKRATPAEAEKAAREGKRLSTRSEQRRGTVTAPAGAGAATTQFNPPKGQNVKERLAWLRKQHPTM